MIEKITESVVQRMKLWSFLHAAPYQPWFEVSVPCNIFLLFTMQCDIILLWMGSNRMFQCGVFNSYMIPSPYDAHGCMTALLSFRAFKYAWYTRLRTHQTYWTFSSSNRSSHWRLWHLSCSMLAAVGMVYPTMHLLQHPWLFINSWCSAQTSRTWVKVYWRKRTQNVWDAYN